MTARSSIAPEDAAALLEIHAALRRSASLEALHYRVVHAIHALVPYDQALLLAWRHGVARAVSASNISVPDRKAPQVMAMEQLATALFKGCADTSTVDLTRQELPPAVAACWARLDHPPLLWLPLLPAETPACGGLLLLRLAAPWSDRERALLSQYAVLTAELWRGWPCRKGRAWQGIDPGWRHLAGVVALLAALLAAPVTQTTLAPVRIVARQPTVVTAPMDGVIREVRVHPGQMVQPGERLFLLDETDPRGQYQVALEEWRVAKAEYDQDAQKSVRDPESGARLALLAAREQLHRIRAEYARRKLEQMDVTAQRTGVVVIDDVDGWIGRPVKTGERVLEVADPLRVEARILLPMASAIGLTPGGSVTLFLDVAPLEPVEARIRQVNYEAEKSPEGHLVFRVVADLVESGSAPPQLGWAGTAKLHGERVALAFQLMRRPLSAMRQYLGW